MSLYKYLLMVDDIKLSNKLDAILTDFFETDDLDEEIIKENLLKLEQIKSIGLENVYNQIINDLKISKIYGKYLNK